ncbi:ABC transporter permease [Natronococcus sp. A-GB7]|uniref:ABC transporter permease n=1 Tax=Natronococcus sp. A-GB7 TaxID=3037649 RepID=UPI00241C6F61|nr:ABC transporter permease [Natronococcus sp. A-GB7]MDG5820744.1 ABC transporter permease [Natronococcus sp. A-GB7]
MATKTETSKFNEYSQSVLDYIRDRPRLQVLLLAGPTAGLLVAFFIVPVLIMVWYAFLTGLPPADYTMENFSRIFDPLYLGIIGDTFLITVATTIFTVTLGYTLAYSMVRFSRKTTLLLLLVILPFWTNYIVRMYAWINILQADGVLNWLLNTGGVVEGSQRFMFSHEAVLVGLIYVWLPLAVLPFYASIKTMDEDLIEAAKDLGAGPLKTFFTVTLPMTKNGIYAGLILVAVPAFGAFVTPALLGGTGSVMIGMVIDNQFNQAFNWNFGAALGVFLTLAVVASLLLAVLAGVEDKILKRPDTGGEN